MQPLGTLPPPIHSPSNHILMSHTPQGTDASAILPGQASFSLSVRYVLRTNLLWLLLPLFSSSVYVTYCSLPRGRRNVRARSQVHHLNAGRAHHILFNMLNIFLWLFPVGIPDVWKYCSDNNIVGSVVTHTIKICNLIIVKWLTMFSQCCEVNSFKGWGLTL